jgi:hypothetical protein
MSPPISEMIAAEVRSAMPGTVHNRRRGTSNGTIIVSIWASTRPITAVRWSMWSRCKRHINPWWALNRPLNANVRSGIFLRSRPRASPASTASPS